jgi:signal transduction histidine kinase
MGMPAVKFPGNYSRAEDDISSEPAPVNILIIDDLPEKILVYKAILEDLNQNLITAQTGEEALKLVLKHEFAVILLDVNMPGMDGFETASLIRKRKKSAKTPIIFLTAFNDEFNMAQGYATGAVDYLPTPVVPEVLKAKIRVFIELYQMRQQAAIRAEERARREAAEESARRKDEFLAMLAHELRNPLAPLRNALHMLQMPSLQPDMIQKAYQVMDRQLQQMVRLVDDLMDVSRITRGKIDLRFETVGLNKAIENAVETARPFIEERDHTLKIEIPEEPIAVKADLVRLSQVFANLLNNAAKYTDAGGQIVLNVEVQDGIAVISIRDTGVGIAQEKLPDIFDLFMQIDTSITRAQGGLGIGLTLVKNIIEMQGGTIEALSDGLDKGSTFIVKLPVVDPVPVEESAEEEAEKQADCAPPLKILIVDDNEASAKTLGWMLEMLGHEITLAYEGPEAIKIAQELHPHVALLDIGLPKMSGYEVCEAMRKLPGLDKTVYIAQTGWGQAEHRRMSKAAGFDFHLVKPLSSESLQEILKTVRT